MAMPIASGLRVPPRDSRASLNWPIVGAAAVCCAIFITGLTAAAVLRPRASRIERKPQPPVTQAEPFCPAVEEPVAAAAPVEQPAPTDLAPLVPEPPRPAAGLESAVVSAASSIPASVPSPWSVPRSPPPEPAAPPLPAKRPVLMCGTSVEFIANPVLAAQHARQEQKLLFLLHVSGDFEDPGFT